MNRLKSIVSFAVALTVLCTCAANTFATGTGTDDPVEEVIFSQDFEGYSEGDFTSTDKIVIQKKNSSGLIGKDSQDNKYLQLQNIDKANQVDSFIKVKPNIPDNIVKYTIRFDMKYQVHDSRYIHVYAGGQLWRLTGTNPTGTVEPKPNSKYAVKTNEEYDTIDDAAEAYRKTFVPDKFYTYEIGVEKTQDGRSFSLSVGDCGSDNLTTIYEGLPNRTNKYGKLASDDTEDILLFYYYSNGKGITTVADLAIDNIVVKGYRAASDISKLGVSKVNGIAITGNNVGIDSEYKGNVKLELDAEAESGIKQISVSVDDGDLQTVESPYILEIDNPEEKASQTVKVYAESNNGGEKETQLTLNYSSVNTKNSKVFEDCDFEAGEGNSLKSGIKTVPGCGIIEVKQLDEDHGNSLTVGVGDQVGNGDIPYADIPLEGNSEVITLNYDILSNETVTNSNNSKKVILLNLLIGEEKKTLELVRFYEKYTKILGTDYYDYKLDEWYNFSFKIDTGTNRISLYLNGVLFASDKKIHSGDNEKIDLTHVRVYGPGELGCGYIAIDNINVVGYYEMPTISSTEQNSESPKKLTVNLSSEIFGDSITKDTVKVINTETGNAVDIEKLEYSNKTITITLSKLLAKDAQYKVVITSDAMLSPVVGFDNDVSHTFTTQPGEIKNTSSVSCNGAEIVASISIENMLQETQTVYAVLTRWKGNTALPIAVKKLEISGGEIGVDQLKDEFTSGITQAQLYLYSDLTASKLLGEKIINLSIN